MPSVCIYFQVHQPMRLRRFTVFDIGRGGDYFDSEKNSFYLERIARKSYIPTNEKLLDLISRFSGDFRVSFSITGILLEQLERFSPDVIDSFQRLVDTGCVELFSETYYHSLAYLISREEFLEQVKMHRKKIRDTFGVRPKVFRNTEAMYNNDIAKIAGEMGYRAIIAEGLSHILGWRSPNYLYSARGSGIRVLLRNFQLSDDVAFRFSTRDWAEFPLTAEKYAAWLSRAEGDLVNIFIDYETFGEHQWEETGIFNFLEHLPGEVLKHENLDFRTPGQLIRILKPVGTYDVPHISSWADVHRDLSAWLENDMQKQAFGEIKRMENAIKGRKLTYLLDTWRKLQTSDHFYFMCTKWFADGDVHKYFNPYDNPYEAFLNYANIITDLKSRIPRGRND
jgi:alpha-amylase